MLDGHTIPQLGFGSGTAHYKQDAVKPILMALRANYTHIDTAQMYDNEDTVGDAISQSGIPREKLFVTTKVLELAEGETIEDNLKGSLTKLKMDYVDLFLLHAAIKFDKPGQLEDVWKQMEAVKDMGLGRSIGVSNFQAGELERILKVARYKPVVNQLEFHPYAYAQLRPVLKLQEEHGILTESYGGLTPLTKKTDGPVNAVLVELAAKIGGTQTQVLMKWLDQKGIIAVTTTSKEERLKEYVDVYSLPNLTQEDIQAIEEAGAKLQYSRLALYLEAERKKAQEVRDGAQSTSA
ncbi:oxidoreductase [Dacryopinax primogenitus]|uniref:Oxidoreductase n=1 Tax=Dacryopinax primogenitus (strain DJM 731) TaxID=1858805 RepID=M5FP46_DACPD|nr:oxidoreductase [Dacryopinax primogenitus]EJT96808.1 oxidoreductase [Dacryopinax primogenitus]